MNHRIFFYVNVTKTGSDGVLRKATEIAARSGYQCKVYEDASCMFADCIEEDEDEPACIVTIGGDGTTLRAVSHAVNQGIEIITPILGINLGKIGFFSETSIEGFEETLKQFSEGDYTIETDRMLKASFKDGREFFALNDFLAYKSGFSSVSHIELGVDGADGADDTAAGAVDLGDLQLRGLADHTGHVAALGDAGLGSGDEHPDALDVGDQAALIFLGNGAFHSGLVLCPGSHVVPDLQAVQLLLGKLHGAFLVVDANDEDLDLVADFQDVFRLHGRIGADFVIRDVAGMLGAEVDLDFGVADSGHGADNLISCI